MTLTVVIFDRYIFIAGLIMGFGCMGNYINIHSRILAKCLSDNYQEK